MPGPSRERLEKNLRLLRGRSARAVEAVRAAGPCAGLGLLVAPDGGVTGSLNGRQLASLRAPLAEAEKFAQSIDIGASAAVVVRGFGLGHHVAALAKRLKGHGAVVVFEPDVALLRAVLERLDCSWLAVSNVAVVTDADDTGAIAAATSGIEAVLAAGTTLVDHPASKARIGDAGERFGAAFTTVMRAVRTNVMTTLVQVDQTLRNLLLNLAWYATVPGVADLKDACKGKPAVVVSAGPSLRRNVELLARPGVRDRVVIIAVQTVLKTLLAKGIRPHFVTALDYHEISRRFYEGLMGADVEGVTLVAEPKCNRAILEAFPGAVRCAGDVVLDGILGGTGLLTGVDGGQEHRSGDRCHQDRYIPPGATVAHLAYYLARHMGCDPVVLIGQDLGFTDGQYYAPGAAIHQVWSGELNEFNTLEMLEWQRIARMRPLLRKVQDQQGRPIYTDEQMSTYLVQFEREFMSDAARGLTTIDATEGGVLKQHTRVMTLHEALEAHAREPMRVPGTPAGLEGGALSKRLDAVRSRLASLRESTGRIAALGREAGEVLEEMLEHQQDQARVNRLIERVSGMAKEAAAEVAFGIVQWVNQTGQFKRYRADRAIQIDPTLSPMEKQKREIERDLVNVRWLADAAEYVGGLLEEAAEKLVRGVWAGSARESSKETRGTSDCNEENRPELARRPRTLNAGEGRLWVIAHVDTDVGNIGLPRDLGAELTPGVNLLQATLARLARCGRVAGVLLLCPDVEVARELVGRAPAGLRVEFEPIDGGMLRDRTRGVGVGRLWARHCWRGGLANLSCYDEAVSPRVAAPAMERRGLASAAFVGAAWSLVDPALVDGVIERHLERPEAHELTFAHAPPGLGACVVSRRVLAELSAANTPLASIGGLIGYLPHAPQMDPIAKPVCVSVEPKVRDLLLRCVPDSPERLEMVRRVYGRVQGAGCAAVADALHGWRGAPEHITVHAGGRNDELLEQLCRTGGTPCVTIVDHGDSLDDALRLVEVARGAGAVGVHLRTPLIEGVSAAREVLAARVDIVSIDLLAEDAMTYAALTGRHGFDRVRDGIAHLIEHRRMVEGLPSLWVVPRITRRDAVYEQIEDFYTRALMIADSGVIDPLPAPIPGERIEPLPLPPNVRERQQWSTRVIAADGSVRDGCGDLVEVEVGCEEVG
ncbi:MAG TPA: 6-hydroxymethylpterin diphosphokinase MptE-like protein [Phycisphaerales bacterium]|nr:6-hydroxymethylpterin diphosphokinase MptE-like protein [Phycisphaerales bacterium]